MDKKILTDKITDILAELNQQLEDIKSGNSNASVHAVELDLFAANAAFLTEHAKVYAKLSEQQTGPSVEDEKEDDFVEVKVAETLKEAPPEMDEVISTEETLSQNEYDGFEDAETVSDNTEMPGESRKSFIDQRFEEEETPEPVDDKKNTLEFEDRLMQPIADKQPKDEAVRLNEKFQGKGDTLYDKIAAQRQQSTAKQVPISNLSRGIGLNERFYFTKALFNGDISAFEQSLNQLDNCGSLGEALEYVNHNLVKDYSWESKEEDSRKFYDVLKRRFI